MSQEPPARPETGPMAFGTDWPGVFIRGDNAMAYSLSLMQFRAGVSDPFVLGQVNSLIRLLGGCDTRSGETPTRMLPFSACALATEHLDAPPQTPPGFLTFLESLSTPEFPVTDWTWYVSTNGVDRPCLTVYGKVPKLPLGDSSGIDRITKHICAYLPAGINVRVSLTEPGPTAP